MRNLIFFAYVLLFWSCEMQPIEELAIEPDTIEQIQGPYQVTRVSKSTILSLGKKLQKRIGFNVIESAQMRQISDFTFDLEASQLTTDTLKRRTYTVPFLAKGDKYSTFNLVLVADSVDNVLDQYVLQYEFDSIQYQDFEVTKDLLASGVTIKRFPFSSFFNDSNPGFLERCDGVFDSNGDPVTCDQVTIDYGSSYGGGSGGSGGSLWITPGGGGGTSSGTCSWTLSWSPCSCMNHMHTCGCNDPTRYPIITISCSDAQMRKFSISGAANMTCMDCSVSDFGSPAFTLTRNATQIDNLLTDFNLSDWHMAYLSLNDAFSTEFKSLLQSELNLDQKAAMITLAAQMEGVLSSQMNQNFGLAVDHLVEGNLIDPIILHYYSIFINTKIAYLKFENPTKYKNPDGSWKKYLLYYDANKEALHFTLDILGLVPVLGEPADLINGVLYVIEGDGVNATLSVASSLPFLGYITSGPKIGFKVIQSATDLQSKQVIRWILDREGFITFGDRSQLRSMFPNILTTEQAHHIIPWSTAIQKHSVIQEAAKSANAFHMNEVLNGIPVDSWRNQPNHDIYNNLILSRLEMIKNDFPNETPDFYYQKVAELINKAKTAIQANPNVHLNQINFR